MKNTKSAKMNQQDWYLKQCGITQYVLRKSTALKGEIATHIDDHIRLLIVAKQKPTEKIYFDILSAIHLREEQTLFLTPAQLIMPASAIKIVTWFIDINPPASWLNQPLVIQTHNLNQLASAPLEKRQLWQQLCQYENYFHTDN